MIKSKKPELLQDEAFMEALFRSMDLNIGSLEGVSSWNEVGTTSDYEDLDEYLYTSWHKYGYKTLFEILLVSLMTVPNETSVITAALPIHNFTYSSRYSCPIAISYFGRDYRII